MVLICRTLCFFLCLHLVATEYGLVKDFGRCRVRCQNHGVCVYELQNPDKHRCICLEGIYFGEFCQFTVGEIPKKTTVPVVHPKMTTQQKTRVLFGDFEDTEDKQEDIEPETVRLSEAPVAGEHLFDKVIPADSDEDEQNNKGLDEPVMVDQNSNDNIYKPEVTEENNNEEKELDKKKADIEPNKIPMQYAGGSFGNYHGHNRLHYDTLSETSSLGSLSPSNTEQDGYFEQGNEGNTWMMARKPREFTEAASTKLYNCWMLSATFFSILLFYNRQLA